MAEDQKLAQSREKGGDRYLITSFEHRMASQARPIKRDSRKDGKGGDRDLITATKAETTAR